MNNKSLLSFLGITLLFISLFIQCKKENIAEEPTGFKFPDIDYVDAVVYSEIKKTCSDHWDLNKMADSTMIIISYNEGYEIYCNGEQTEGQNYSFKIITDGQGKWINDNKVPTTNERKFYFNPSKLDLLKLINLRNFWSEGLNIDTLTFHYFSGDIGYQDAIELHIKKHEGIAVSVFQTNIDAVRAMEYRRNNVSGIFIRGKHDIIPGNWWYMENLPSIVVVQKLNTILEVRNYSDFDTVKDTLYNTAREIARRIEVLSD
ncbi:MAG: hypothetical protein ACM3O8_05595 [Methylococcaceae bacterium]